MLGQIIQRHHFEIFQVLCHPEVDLQECGCLVRSYLVSNAAATANTQQYWVETAEQG